MKMDGADLRFSHVCAIHNFSITYSDFLGSRPCQPC
jgi:hypothetical protein